LGYIWGDYIKEDLNMNLTNAVLIPVPMHPKKKSERGFNQAEVMAKSLAKKLDAAVENILRRIHDTPPLAGLPPKERAENLKDVFVVNKKFDVKDKICVLIDDIYTTGTSLNECAKTLKNAGAKKIICLTLTIAQKSVKSKGIIADS